MFYSSSYRYITPDMVWVIARPKKNELLRTVKVIVGESYVINPLDPNTNRLRGLRCTVKKLKNKVAVVSLEDKRTIRVPLDDLATP